MARHLVMITVAAALAGQLLAAGALAETGAVGEPVSPSQSAEDESWTWFGMGFENRRRSRSEQQDRFGPESRPSGGFGGSSGTGGLGGSQGGGFGSGRGNSGAGRAGR